MSNRGIALIPVLIVGAIGAAWISFGLYLTADKQEELRVGGQIVRQEVTIVPVADSSYDIGTTSKAWREGWFDELCLTADSCKTAWPSGSGSGSVGTSSVGQIGQLAMFTTSGATPELIAPVATTTLTASLPLSF